MWLVCCEGTSYGDDYGDDWRTAGPLIQQLLLGSEIDGFQELVRCGCYTCGVIVLIM